MSKKVKMLVVTGVAMLVLIGAFVALKFLLPEKEEEPNDLYSGELHYIFNEKDNEIETITVDYQGDHYVIEELSEGKYGIAEIEDCTSSDINFRSMIYSSKSLATYNKVDGTNVNLADYGLDKPQSKVTFAFKDGKTYTLLFGNINSSQSGYYCMLEGGSDIYVLQTQTTDYYMKTESEYVDLTVVTAFDTSDETAYPVFSYFDISRKDLDQNIYIRPMTAAEKKSDMEVTAIMKMTTPIDAMVRNDAVQECLYGFFGLTAKSCADFRLTEDRMAEFGFDDPVATLHTKYDNSEVTLMVGDYANEEKTQYYLHSSKQPSVVYVVDGADVSWLKVTASDLVSPVAVQPYIKDLAKITVRLKQGKEYVFALSHETDDNDKSITSVTCNGEAVDTNNFKRYLQLLMYTSGEDIYEGDPVDASNEMLYIEYEYNNGAEGDIVKILKNTARYGVMEVNGKQNFTARLAYVDKLQTELDNLLAGIDVDTEW